MQPPIVIVAYPLLPWLGVMALGYAFGRFALRSKDQRLKFELRAGVTMVASFMLLRWSNLYGDPAPWTPQDNWWRTLLSFFNVQKYPPSLLFLLATLGIAALVMFAIDSTEQRAAFQHTRGVLEVYGRVPFFFFVLHIALIHLLALFVTAAMGGDWRWWIGEIPNGGVLTGRPPGYETGALLSGTDAKSGEHSRHQKRWGGRRWLKRIFPTPGAARSPARAGTDRLIQNRHA
jgi:uncharacterized membrane protein